MTPIYLIDELVAQPGQGPALLAAYLDRYVPGAQQRGLTLLHRFVSPPMWLTEQSNTLVFLWSLEGGARAWWAARIGSGRDATVDAWWRESEALVLTRSRRFLSEAADVELLSHV